MSEKSAGSGEMPALPLQNQQTALENVSVGGNLTIGNVDQTVTVYLPPSPRTEPKPFTVPYERNPHFTGRAEILAQIHATLGQSGAAALNQAKAIHGLGGVGKTQTAVEYAYRYFEDERVYDWVFWVNASNLTLAASFGSIAADLALPNHETQKLDENTAAVSHWLETHDRWLLIFDNVDDPKSLKPYRPKNSNGRILLTSRSQRFESLGIANSIPLNDMTPAEAHEFLRGRTGRSPLAPLKKGGTEPNGLEVPLFKGDLGGSTSLAATEQQALIALAEALGYLPLALEQAGAYMLTKNVSFAAYLRSYQQRRLRVIEKQRPEMGDYPESVAMTWAINFEAVKVSSPAAADLLNLSAFLAPDNIPYELLILGKEHLGELLSEALADAPEDELVLPELLEELTRYSLIRLETDNRYSIHRLVQEVLRDALQTEGQQWQAKVIEALNQAFPNVEFENWGRCERLVDQVQVLIEENSFPASSALARVLNETGYYLDDQGRYAKAEPLYLKSLELKRKQVGEQHPDIATTLNNLACLYRAQGRYSKAEPLSLQALQMRRVLLGENHLDVAKSLGTLAFLYRVQGRYLESEPLCLRALQINRALLGENHPNVANNLENLALLYDEQKRYAEAEPFSLQALYIRKTLLGEQHPDVAISLSNLAALYIAQERYLEAEPLCLQALQINRAWLGENHPDVTSNLSNLAVLYNLQKRYAEAELLYLQTLRLTKFSLGEQHPDVAFSLNNLAGLYYFQGRYSEAEPLYLEGLAILFDLLGEIHPNTQSMWESFVLFLQQAVEAGRAAELSDHPTTRAVLAQIRAEQQSTTDESNDVQ